MSFKEKLAEDIDLSALFNYLFVIITIFLMVIINGYAKNILINDISINDIENNDIVQIEAEYEEPIVINDSLESKIFDYFRESKYQFVRKSQMNSIVTYEVTVEKPLYDFKKDTIALSNGIKAIWSSYEYTDLKVRICVLNNGNRELVDLIVEDGIAVWKRI